MLKITFGHNVQTEREEKMKSYSEFKEYVKENVLDYMPAKFENAQISIHQVVKNNDVVLDGLNIHNPDK